MKRRIYPETIAITALLTLAVGLMAYIATKGPEEAPVEEALPAPVYEPEPWRGRLECTSGGLMLYRMDGLVDFIVTAQPSGWMWEMFKEDGTVVLFQQPSRVFCSAIPENN